MNFDDSYFLKFSIKLSDYKNAYKYYKRAKNKYDKDVEKNLALYNTDKKIIEMYKKNKIYNSEFLINLVKNPFDNFNILQDYFSNFPKNTNNLLKIDDFFDEDKSLLLTLLTSNTNSFKKLKTFDFLINNQNFDFNKKNHNGQTNSQILVASNPTDMDSVYLEKIEKLMQNKNEENKNLFYSSPKRSNNEIFSLTNLEKSIKEFIHEPEESYKINFADMEFNLLKLNLKLRRMYEFDIIELSVNDSEFNKMHTNIMNTFIFDKLLLEKI
jgi:hypothetical protein